MSNTSPPVRMICTISSELLSELDKTCYKNLVCRSEFVREALAIYLKNFHAQSSKLDAPNEKRWQLRASSALFIFVNLTFVTVNLGGFLQKLAPLSSSSVGLLTRLPTYL